MQRWVLLGTGILLMAAMKGCPQTEQPSASLPSKPPTAISNQSQETDIPKDLESSSLRKPAKLNSSVRTPQNTKIGLLVPQVLTSSRLEEKRQLSSLPSDSLLSPSIRSLNSESHLRNESDPEPPVNQANFNDIRSEQELQKQDNDQLSSTSPESKNTAKQNLNNDTDVIPSTLGSSKSLNLGKIPGEQRSSEECKSPRELDLSVNNCSDRVASEGFNTNVDNTLIHPTYVNPLANYQTTFVRQPIYVNPPSNYGTIYVRGYVRKNGIYVRPHFRRK